MFKSKLPGDVKKRKAAAELVTRTLDRDLKEKKTAERVVPYTDRAFHQAAIEWVIATDQVRITFSTMLYHDEIYYLQPIHALEHPKFRDMIDLTARATCGVKIPGRKSTRTEIGHMFKNHLTKLKSQLNVEISVMSFSCSHFL